MADIRIESELWSTSMLPEGLLESWLAANGTLVEIGAPLAMLRIEDALHEICAPAGGRLVIETAVNGIVEPGSVIGQILPAQS